LCALHVRVRRHQVILVLSGLTYHHVLKILDGGVHLLARIHTPEPSGGGNLVVSAAASVKLRCDIADLLVEKPVDHRVYIFVGGDWLFATRKPTRNRIEPRFDPTTLLE
jgi:hypothetical protein